MCSSQELEMKLLVAERLLCSLDQQDAEERLEAGLEEVWRWTCLQNMGCREWLGKVWEEEKI